MIKKEAAVNAQNIIPGIVKQGYLNKKGQNYKTWRKRYFIALDGFLLYFKDDTDLFHPRTFSLGRLRKFY